VLANARAAAERMLIAMTKPTPTAAIVTNSRIGCIQEASGTCRSSRGRDGRMKNNAASGALSDQYRDRGVQVAVHRTTKRQPDGLPGGTRVRVSHRVIPVPVDAHPAAARIACERPARSGLSVRGMSSACSIRCPAALPDPPRRT
jgi:hypothetical protein